MCCSCRSAASRPSTTCRHRKPLLLGKLLLAAAGATPNRIGIADDGYRVVMNCNGNGGQTVFHIHMHLLGGAPLTGGFA